MVPALIPLTPPSLSSTLASCHQPLPILDSQTCSMLVTWEQASPEPACLVLCHLQSILLVDALLVPTLQREELRHWTQHEGDIARS